MVPKLRHNDDSLTENRQEYDSEPVTLDLC